MRIGILAGEPSGDRLAAGLIEAIRRRAPQASFTGMAGPRMAAAGCVQRFSIDQLSVVGFVEVLRQYPRLRRLREEVVRAFVDDPPDVFIGVDVPDFVLDVETRLRAAGIRTAHLVSPTVWAWRAGRVATVARAVDLLLCIFPFEPAYYAGLDLRCEFVGHPLADEFPLDIDRGAERARLVVHKGRKNDGAAELVLSSPKQVERAAFRLDEGAVQLRSYDEKGGRDRDLFEE